MTSNIIPKIIHQIWYQGENNIPNDYPNYSLSWKKLNPHYDHIMWDENKIINLISDHFPHFLDKFNSYPNVVQKVDAAKYMILYVYGGIYVDMDCECIKNIDDLLFYYSLILLKCDINIAARLFFYNTTNDILQNCFAASVKNHPFWLYCVDLMINENIQKLPNELHEKYIFRTTGPGLFTKAYNDFQGDKNNIKIYDAKIVEPFTPCQYDNYDCSKNDCRIYAKDSYAIHHYGARHSGNGWLSDFGKSSVDMYCKYSKYFYIFSCILIIIIFIIYIKYF